MLSEHGFDYNKVQSQERMDKNPLSEPITCELNSHLRHKITIHMTKLF